MSLACASLRRVASEAQKPKTISRRRASVATAGGKELEELVPKRKSRRSLMRHEDKENMPRAGNTENIPPMSWSVKKVLRPTKEDRLDQTMHVGCLSKNFLTSNGLFRRASSKSANGKGLVNQAYDTPKPNVQPLNIVDDTPVRPIKVPMQRSHYKEGQTSIPDKPQRIRRHPHMNTVRRPLTLGEDLPPTVTVRAKRPAVEELVPESTLHRRLEPYGQDREILETPKRARIDTPKTPKQTVARIGGIKLQLSPANFSNITFSSPARSCTFESPLKEAESKSIHNTMAEPASQFYTSKMLKDLSLISQQSGAHMPEQPSTADLSGAFHSTFNYPLHSTLCYPLHSTFSMPKDFIPKGAPKGLRAPVLKTVCEQEECESSFLSEEESIDVDEYAANYSARMRRQQGQAELSDMYLPGKREAPVGCDSVQEDSNDSTLTHVTRGGTQVWYSPNNTLVNTQRRMSSLSAARRRSQATPATPDMSDYVRYRTQIPDGCSEDSGCDSQSPYRSVMVDNTGRHRSIASHNTTPRHNMTSERKKDLVRKMKSFNHSCASRSVLMMI